MEHTRKFVLVNSGSLSRFGGVRNAAEGHAGDLRQQMSNILHDDGLTDQRKLSRYQQVENEYITERSMINEPVKLELHDAGEEAFSARGKPTDVITSAVSFLELTYGARARALGEYLLSDYAKSLKWNRKGQLIANGWLIEKSNIIALMTDVLAARSSRHPAGCFEFSRVLQKSPFPLPFIQEQTGMYKNPQFVPGSASVEELLVDDQPWSAYAARNLPFYVAPHKSSAVKTKGKSRNPVVQGRVDVASILGGMTERTSRSKTSGSSDTGEREFEENRMPGTSVPHTPGGASAFPMTPPYSTPHVSPSALVKIFAGASRHEHTPSSDMHASSPLGISTAARDLFGSHLSEREQSQIGEDAEASQQSWGARAPHAQHKTKQQNT